MMGIIDAFSTTHPFAEGRNNGDNQIQFHRP